MFASYVTSGQSKLRLIFSRINGPNEPNIFPAKKLDNIMNDTGLKRGSTFEGTSSHNLLSLITTIYEFIHEKECFYLLTPVKLHSDERTIDSWALV